MTVLDACYTLVCSEDSSESTSFNDLRNSLEKGTEKVKIETMKKILVMMINGEPMSQLLMHVIRFVMPCQQKILKKLMLLFFEVCPKTNPDGSLKQEWILVW
jgi:coatomer subunit beta